MFTYPNIGMLKIHNPDTDMDSLEDKTKTASL